MSDLTDIAATHLAELDTLIEQLPSNTEEPYPPALPQGHSASPADVFRGVATASGDWETAMVEAAAGGRVKEIEELLEKRKKGGSEKDKEMSKEDAMLGKVDKQESTPELTPSLKPGAGEPVSAVTATAPSEAPAVAPPRQPSLGGADGKAMPPTPESPNVLISGVSGGTGAASTDREVVSRLYYRLCPEAPLPALQLLLKTGEVNPNYADDISSRGPLHELAIHGRASAMENIFNPDINTSGITPKANPTDIYGRTPLHYAAMYGRTEIASFLIRNGAEVDFEDHDGISPLIYAIKGGHSGTVQTLLNAGASTEPHSVDSPIPLCLACEYGHLAVTEVLLARGCRVDVPSPEGLNPLHLAAREGRADIALALLRHGAAVDPRDGYDGWTPLLHAAASGHKACLKVLIDHGADRSVVDDQGWNSWTHALYRGHIACAKLVELVSDDDDDDDEDVFEARTTIPLKGEVVASPETNKSAPPEEEMADLSLGGADDSVAEELAMSAALLNRQLVDTTSAESLIQPAVPQGEQGITTPIAPSELLSGRLDPNDQDALLPVSRAGSNIETMDDRGRLPESAIGLMPLEATKRRQSSPADILDTDIIPHLSLPPPIVPFRIYGHNYLDKRIYFQVKLGHQQNNRAVDLDPTIQKQPLHLFGSRQLSSLKLIISTKPDSGIPYNIILPHPPKEDAEPYTFLVDKPPTLQFDIYPTFGTKVIARGVCLPTALEQILREGRGDGSTGAERLVVPLVDTHLRVLGELCFEIAVVTPFKHSGVEIGGKVDTYWKSTRVVTPTAPVHRQSISGPSMGLGDRSLGSLASTSYTLSPIAIAMPSAAGGAAATATAVASSLSSSLAQEERGSMATLLRSSTEPQPVVQSFVTASSLAEEYVVLNVQLTRDGVPIVYGDWVVALAPNLTLAVNDLLAEQFVNLPKDVVTAGEDDGEEDSPKAKLPYLNDPEAALHTRSSTELAKMVYASRVTLADVLRILPQSVGVNILVKYPTASEKAYMGLTDRHDVNAVVDAVLKVVYDAATDSQRSVIFSSFNPAVCTAANWKQPNYAVFFATHAGYRHMPSERPPGSQITVPLAFGKIKKKKKGKKGKKGKKSGKGKGKGKAGLSGAEETAGEGGDANDLQLDDEQEIHEADDRCMSIKEAIRFAKSSNLLGIICDARPLVQVPVLINTIKEGGLLLATFGEANWDSDNVRQQEMNGVDAIMVDNVVSNWTWTGKLV